jgi:hypothetical protein
MEVAYTGKLALTTKSNKSREIELTNHTAWLEIRCFGT